MSKVVSVDKSILHGGLVTWFVTLEDDNGNKTRVEVGEAEARRFQQVLMSQHGSQPRLLTETLP